MSPVGSLEQRLGVDSGVAHRLLRASVLLGVAAFTAVLFAGFYSFDRFLAVLAIPAVLVGTFIASSLSLIRLSIFGRPRAIAVVGVVLSATIFVLWLVMVVLWHVTYFDWY